MKKTIISLLITLLFINCNQNSAYNDPIPKHESFKINSKHVKEERTINVWVPQGYENTNRSFSVLYMPDGGIKEDFPHIANSLKKLITNKKIEPVILVGIENTERGRDLTGSSTSEYDATYCPLSDGAKDFRAFISNELVPEIETRYRTKNKKGIIGESLAGLFVMETFFISPTSFDFYIAMDPALWWNNHYLVENAETLFSNISNNKELTLWFTGSSAKDIYIHTRNLETKFHVSAPDNLNWKYLDKPEEKHNTIFRATKEQALKWVLKPE